MLECSLMSGTSFVALVALAASASQILLERTGHA
jgi:hypothetical protein